MPPIQIPINDTLETLQNVLKRRAEAHQELFERKALSGGDYRQLEDKYDRTSFIQPEDAATTMASIYYTRRKWTRYAKRDARGQNIIPVFIFNSIMSKELCFAYF
jgi:hypothetical protein